MYCLFYLFIYLLLGVLVEVCCLIFLNIQMQGKGAWTTVTTFSTFNITAYPAFSRRRDINVIPPSSYPSISARMCACMCACCVYVRVYARVCARSARTFCTTTVSTFNITAYPAFLPQKRHYNVVPPSSYPSRGTRVRAHSAHKN